MGTIEYVKPEQFTVVRAHRGMEDLAEAMVTLGATSSADSVPVAAIANQLGSPDRKSIYNRLARPGFVKVDNGPGSYATFYYLFGNMFGDLARAQGTKFYPVNLGPLAGHRFPKTEFRDSLSRLRPLDIKTHVEGNRLPPTTVETLDFSLDDIKAAKDQAEDAALHIINVLRDPLNPKHSLDTVICSLVSVRAWVENLSVEERIYAEGEISGSPSE